MDHLIDHKYTILEIERMRIATDALMFPTVWSSRTSSYRPGTGGKPGEQETKVEVQVRTYMLAGIRPEELEALQKEREAESARKRESLPERHPVRLAPNPHSERRKPLWP